MKTIENESSMQDYQLYQMYYNQQLQMKYDEFADKDGNEFDENVRDDVRMIDDDDDNYNKEIDNTKVITLEEIMKNCKAASTNDLENPNNENQEDIKNGIYNHNGKNSNGNGIANTNHREENDLGIYYNY